MLSFTKNKISDLSMKLSAEQIVRISKILLIDDEPPELINDLKKSGFSVDHEADLSPDNLHILERQHYNLVILDFGGVGSKMAGSKGEEGLSLLRYIKRRYPATIVLAYTSKALTTEHADFFRLADGVLLKDLGIGDSMEKIEEALAQAHEITNLWKGILHAAAIESGSKNDLDLQHKFVKYSDRPQKLESIRSRVAGSLTDESRSKVASMLFEKLVEVCVKGAIG